MGNTKALHECVAELVGRRLEDLQLACEMMMFRFGELSLHAQCLTRIFHGERILTTTYDYQSWDGVCAENNDEWYFVEQYRELITGGTVVSAQCSCCNDLTIHLDNAISIQLLISNGEHHFGEEQEQWVLFKPHDQTHPFVTVYSRSVEIAAER